MPAPPSNGRSRLSPADQLVVDNINLARAFAKRFAIRTRRDYDEMEAVAFVGLVKACRRFNPDAGFKVSTYLSRIIEGTMKQWLRDHGYLIRYPRSWREVGPRARRLQQEGKTTQQIAELVGLSHQDADELLTLMSSHATLQDDLGSMAVWDDELEDDHTQGVLAAAEDAFQRIDPLDRESLEVFWQIEPRRAEFPRISLLRFRATALRVLANRPPPVIEDRRRVAPRSMVELEQELRKPELAALLEPAPSAAAPVPVAAAQVRRPRASGKTGPSPRRTVRRS